MKEESMMSHCDPRTMWNQQQNNVTLAARHSRKKQKGGNHGRWILHPAENVRQWNGYMWTTVCVRPENDYPRTKRRSATGRQNRHSTRFVRICAKEQGPPMRWNRTKRHEDNWSHGQPWQSGPGLRKRSGRRPVFHVCAPQYVDALVANPEVHARNVCWHWGLQVHEGMQEEGQGRDLWKDMYEVAPKNSI